MRALTAVAYATQVGINHIGRRGAFLAFLTLLNLTVGYALLQPPPVGLNVRAVYQPFIDIMPLVVWSWAWVTAGLLCAAGIAVQRVRPVAFASAALVMTGWALGYFIGWQAHLPVFSRGYQTGAIFTALAAVCLIVAGWRENGR